MGRVTLVSGRLTLALFVGLLAASAARGQVDPVRVSVAYENVGLFGAIRPGTWAPILLSVENRTSQARQVTCEWVLPDIDGDSVESRRSIVLNPQRTTNVWLYAQPPVNTRDRALWRVRVIDGETGAVLAGAPIGPGRLLDQRARAVAIFGAENLGLSPYNDNLLQHEKCVFVRGVDPRSLPDRWYGLSMLQTIIWTPRGGDPLDQNVPLEAIRQWVRRGGHLVVILPAIGDPWSAPQLADLLPPVKATVLSDQPIPMKVLGSPLTPTPPLINLKVFDEPIGGRRASVIFRDEQNRPLVVAGQVGFGRVTVIGIDLTDPRLMRMGLPTISSGFWNEVFGWRLPGYEQQYIDSLVKAKKLVDPRTRRSLELGRFMPKRIALQGTAAGALLAAIFLFGVYWLVAGPVSFIVLRQRRQLHHSWLLFVTVVLAFSVVAWAGALFVRPSKARIQHFTVLDADAGSGDFHVHSWFSLFVPSHGRTDVAIEGQGERAAANVIASAGVLDEGDEGGFLDPQRYSIDSGAPQKVSVPMRATSKQFEIDYLGPPPANTGGNPAWVMPQGKVVVRNNWPTGQLSHGLPGTLTDVTFIYTDGDRDAWVWQVPQFKQWPPGKVLTLTPPKQADRLVVEPSDFLKKRSFNLEGWLGKLIFVKTGNTFQDVDPMGTVVPPQEMVQLIEILTFYGALPPPDFAARGGITGIYDLPWDYQRKVGRELDLTAMLALRRLIVMGQLAKSPLPAPVTVNGGTVPSSQGSWTVVRWIYPLD